MTLGRPVWLWATALLAALVLVHQGSAWLAAERTTIRLAAGELELLAAEDTERGRFAQARNAEQSGAVDAALEGYLAVAAGDDPQLAAAAGYNMGNIYLKLALHARRRDDATWQALAELAKERYRAALALYPELWDARYNLERALQLQPDVAAVDSVDEFMPEHSQRALATVPVEGVLP